MDEHPPTDDRRSGARAIERAVRVLRAFEGETADLGVSQVAAAVDLPVSTVHRMVRALTGAGLLAQDPESERYHLGSSLAVLGQLASERLGYADARPVLEALAADTGESVNLGVLVGNEVLVVLRVSSRHSLRFEQAPGTRVPAHASAMGKVLLAARDDPVRTAEDVLAMPRLTKHTITSRRALAAELRRVGEQGWALNDEERDPGVRAVAAPVTGANGRTTAAVAVQGPSVRLTDPRVPQLAEQARAAAAQVASVIAPA